jgi:hypothetical protein
LSGHLPFNKDREREIITDDDQASLPGIWLWLCVACDNLLLLLFHYWRQEKWLEFVSSSYQRKRGWRRK